MDIISKTEEEILADNLHGSVLKSNSGFFVQEETSSRFIPFYLSEEFVQGYAKKKVPWGPLGEFTYMRTYSRTYEDEYGKTKKEKWFETVRRVVEGCFTIQKRHCFSHRVPWYNGKAQASAKIMYDLIFNMKFLPPGRGIWMSNTEHVNKVGAACLNNCFEYNTEFITSEGVKKLGDCKDTQQTILTNNGKWVKAPINSFGKQQLYELILTRCGVKKTIFTTKDHRWFCIDRRVKYRNFKYVEFLTKDLRPNKHKLQCVFGQNCLNSSNLKPSSIGIMHGICYGDGTSVETERHSNRLELFGEKMKLSNYFNKKDIEEKKTKTIIKNLPNYYKRLPDIHENSSYLLGWLIGYFAADGSVSNGSSILHSSNKKSLKFVRDVCYKLGIGSNRIRSCKRISNLTNREHTIHSVVFISKFLTSDFFLRDKHKKSFLDKMPTERENYWTVNSVTPTNRYEEVFCVTVKNEGKFALADNILTGNCSYVSSKNLALDPVGPFRFLMDMSMLGVGVGFDTKGAGEIIIKQPAFVKTAAIVPDTREGWVETMSIVLNGFFTGSEIPEFDYSIIRPEGAPIKGFGGTASGSGPLKQMVNMLTKMLITHIDQKITSTIIVDICAMIGKCVVSGNVRRTALIALGDPNDEQFINMKDYKLFPKELKNWRWASNNSVFAEVGQDYTDIAKKIAVNGEPGLFWLDNAKKYSRMVDPQNDLDYKAVGCNPCCVVGETLIAVADGRNAVPIKQLVDEDNDVPVYSLDKNGKSTISYMRQFHKTGEKVPVYKVTLDDGSCVRVTEDHKFIRRDGYIALCYELQAGDSLMPFRAYVKRDRRYVETTPGKENWILDIQSRRIFEAYSNKKIPKKVHIHHIDKNKKNDLINNLEAIPQSEHISFHSSGESNPMYGKQHSKDTKRKIGNKTIDRMEKQKIIMKKYWDSEEWRSQFKGESLKKWHKGVQKEYFEKAISTGLKAKYNKVGKCIITRTCDQCKVEYDVPYRLRNTAFCSQKCNLIFLNTGHGSKKRKQAQKDKFELTQKAKLASQIKIYNDLKFKLKRDPFKLEWMEGCKQNSVPYRIRQTGSTGNKFALTSYKQLKELAAIANHKVVSVEFDGHEDVYNGTVDSHHTLGVISSKLLDDSCNSCTGIYLHQSEQTLESYELCNLVETFPSLHATYDEYRLTLKYAYLYAKTVTLLPTHWEPTNAVLLRNRRIGTSQSGIIDAFIRHGRQTVLEWSQQGYKYLRELDGIYSDWLCIPRSIKITSVKPSGSVSLLPGVSPGIHYAHSEYYIRRIIVAKSSPLVNIMVEAGYNVVPCYGKEDTMMVVEFPVKTKYFIKGKKEVTMWEQFLNASDYQKYWCDNQVSITVTFKKDEVRDIANALSIFDSRLKSVSMLPYNDHGYKQAPYEEIDEATYIKMSKNLKKPNYTNFINQAIGEKYCDGDSCQLPAS